jgi:hypothetical protein
MATRKPQFAHEFSSVGAIRLADVRRCKRESSFLVKIGSINRSWYLEWSYRKKATNPKNRPK